MTIRRGDIYYIEKRNDTVGHEQWSGRPAVVVSNDEGNATAETVEVVYLTSRPKRDMPEHVVIRATGIPSTVLCEQIWTVSTERIQSLAGRCSAEEMQKINRALMYSIGLDGVETTEPAGIPDPETDRELYAVRAKYEMLKELYDELLERIAP